MSASREKKLRQDLTTQEGYVDSKAQRQAKETAAQRKSRALYVTIAVLFVAVSAVLLVVQSGIVQRTATAVTVDGEKFTPGELDYFYYNTYSSVRNSSYSAYLGLDTSAPLDSQPVGDLAKMILGVEDQEAEITWAEYLKNTAKDNLAQVYRVSKAANAAGYANNADVQAELDQTLASLKSFAKSNGYSVGTYLKLVYGNNMTRATFEKMLRMSLTAQQYEEDYTASLTYTDEELESYYADHRNDFDIADYERIYFNGTAASTTDADGAAVEPTAAEQAAAASAAKDAAADAVARYAEGEELSQIAAAYADIATYTHVEGGSYSADDVGDWLFDAARKDGDVTVIDTDGGSYFLLFHSCQRPSYNMVNVRHILSRADTSALNTSSETYEAESQAIWDAAEASAQSNLDTWRSGEATAESFAALAAEVSEDPGSAADGGLISDISKTSSYVQPFLDWCFEDGRQVGDAGIIESSYGYHVMYLDSFGAPYWQDLVTSRLESDDLTEWMDSLTGDVVVEEGSGMKYVG